MIETIAEPGKILVLIVFLFVYVLIMTELIDRTVTALIGAVLMIFYQFLTMEGALEELHEILSILLLIIGMFIIVEVTKDAGIVIGHKMGMKAIGIQEGNLYLAMIVPAIPTPDFNHMLVRASYVAASTK